MEPIESLDFSGKRLGVACATVIAKLVEGNRALTNLNLAVNDIGVDGAKALAAALREGSGGGYDRRQRDAPALRPPPSAAPQRWPPQKLADSPHAAREVS